MRKSILVTAAIAVTAGALALAFSQTEQGKTFFGNEIQETTSDLIASAMTPETAAEEEAPVTTEASVAADTTTADATVEQPTMTPTNDTAGMTPVDLDKLPASATAQAATQANLNEQAPAAGEAAADAKVDAANQAAAAETSSNAEAASDFAGSTKIDIAAALVDREMGSKDAPVTVYDYSSLTCPHCANFHNDILPKVKENYIDNGKVRWVFRGFPLNEPALKGEMISRCAPKDQYSKLQDLMYKNQQRWAFAENPMSSLSMLVRLAGITDDMFLSCVNNTDLQAALLKKYQEEGEKFKINSTPTFVFNDGERTVSGVGSYEGFAYDLDTILKKKGALKETPRPAPAQSLIPVIPE